MESKGLAYSILQYSPYPDRFEFVNVGVLVFDLDNNRVISRHSPTFSRVRKFFGEASVSFLRVAVSDFAALVEHEFVRSGWDVSAGDFNKKRASVFKITPILPVFGKSPDDILNRLFTDLVEVHDKPRRSARVSTLLKRAFQNFGVLDMLDQRPHAVNIAGWSVSFRADFGYQNGVYNLIDTARFDDPERVLSETGKRLIEGRALSETNKHRLVVVGDFGDQSASYVSSVKQELNQVGAKLYQLNEVEQLADEIKRSAH